MRKRIKQRDKKTHVAVAILASFVMFSSILSPVSVDTQVKAAEKTAGSWEELQKTLGELSANSTMTIKLTGDLIFPDAEAGAGAEDTGAGADETGEGADETGEGADETGEGADETAGDSDAQSEEKKTDIKPIIINNSLKITLDLNGHTIDRGLKGKGRVADGYVIKVAEKASLTVTDTSEKPGLITGGANEGNGGGILCEPNSSLTIDGGVNIRDNEAENVGGIYIDNGDDVRIGSCTIWGNIAAKNGGGIYGGTADVAFLGGLTKIKNNIGPDEKDNDFYITKGMSKLRFWVYADAKKIKKTLSSDFKKASRIGILMEEMKQEISDGYGKVNSIEASVYFFYNTTEYMISTDKKKSEVTIVRDQEKIKNLTQTLLEIYDDNGSLMSSKEYSSFISALNTAQSATGERIIILGGDYSSDDPIEIKGTVTIDLNGHYIKRDRDYETKKNGSVIIINKDATLTIKDSRPKVKGYDGVKGGVIAGGASTNGGGGITIKKDGHLIMKGGTIYDCVSDEDGGGGESGIAQQHVAARVQASR